MQSDFVEFLFSNRATTECDGELCGNGHRAVVERNIASTWNLMSL